MSDHTYSDDESMTVFREQQAQCAVLASGMTDLLNELPRPRILPAPKATLVVLLQRATGWMHSLGKLDRVVDYQAHSAACRALLELVIDVALISHEPDLHEMMADFEESALLKAADRQLAYFKEPTSEAAKYVADNTDRIKKLRQKHWSTDRHPNTWLGKNLMEMAKEVDRRVGSNHEAFYAEHYARLCWGTHGSTLMMLRKSETLVLHAGAWAVMGSQRLAMEIVERVVEALGYDPKVVADVLAGRLLVSHRQQQIDALQRIESIADNG